MKVCKIFYFNRMSQNCYWHLLPNVKEEVTGFTAIRRDREYCPFYLLKKERETVFVWFSKS